MPALPGYAEVTPVESGGSSRFPDGTYNATVKSATYEMLKDQYPVTRIVLTTDTLGALEHDDLIFHPTPEEFMQWDSDRQGRFKRQLEGLGLRDIDLDNQPSLDAMAGKIVEVEVRTYEVKQGKNKGKKRTATNYKRVVSDSPAASMPTAAERLRMQAAAAVPAQVPAQPTPVAPPAAV